MSSLQDLQQEMINFLLNGDADAERWIADQPPLTVAQRLSIYGSAYVARLREAIENDHELLWTYLGDESFELLVTEYVRNHPSHITSLRYFADGLPEFLRKQEPFSSVPQLAELAAFERLLMEVFDAADADRADKGQLSNIPPNMWPSLKLEFHPSVRFFRSPWGGVGIWKALKAEETPPDPPSDPTDQVWLLWRGEDRLSQFIPLTEEESALLDAAMNGSNFARLCEMLAESIESSEVSGRILEYLLNWLDQGLITVLRTNGTD